MKKRETSCSPIRMTDKPHTTEPAEHYAYQFWPEAPDGPTIVAGKYSYMAGDFYGRFVIQFAGCRLHA
jgi:hypothetical protein